MGELTVSMVEDPDGVRLIFGQLRDVTDQRELQRQLEHRSLHDPLTGLANRALFSDRVSLAHRRHRRYGSGPVDRLRRPRRLQDRQRRPRPRRG